MTTSSQENSVLKPTAKKRSKAGQRACSLCKSTEDVAEQVITASHSVLACKACRDAISNG